MKPEELKAKIEKLPKWVQEHIDDLTRQLANVTEDRKNLSESLNGGKPSSIFQNEYGRPKVYFPANCEVVFLVPNPRWDRPEEFGVSFERHYKTDEIIGLKVRSGWDRLTVLPDAANGITIRGRGRD